MKTSKKYHIRLLSLFLALCFLTTVPLPAFAEEETPAEEIAIIEAEEVTITKTEEITTEEPAAPPEDSPLEPSDSPDGETPPEEAAAPPSEEVSEEAVMPPEEALPAPEDITAFSILNRTLSESDEAPLMVLSSPPPSISIADALTLPNDWEELFVLRGTAVLLTGSRLVLQDDSGGVCLSFSEMPDVSLGDDLEVTCERSSAGFSAYDTVQLGSSALPTPLECTLADAPENRLIQIGGAMLGEGCITQDSVCLPLSAALPEGIAVGDCVNAMGVLLDGKLYAHGLSKAKARTETMNTWYPVQVEALLPTDTAIFTVTNAEGTIFVPAWNEQSRTFSPVEVQRNTEGNLECPASMLTWNVTQSSQGMTLSSSQGYLSSRNSSIGLTLSSDADYWTISEGYLYHLTYVRYLAYLYSDWRMVIDHQGLGQSLQFWRSTPVSDIPPSQPDTPVSRPYFGQLHAHSTLSSGLDTPEQLYATAVQEGMDFFAVTDHSNSFDNSRSGNINQDGAAISSDWAAGKAAAAAAATETFLPLFGYELSWPPTRDLGHIATFCTPGWLSYEQEEASTLERYYEALVSCPGSVSQFNHPGEYYGDFEDFSHYDQRYDDAIFLLEVSAERSFSAYDRYTRALDRGWHVAPSSSQSSRGRTAIWADALTEKAIFDAIRQYRVYATGDPDLSISFTVDGQSMGSILTQAETLEATLSDPTDSVIGLVEVIVDGGRVFFSQTVQTAQAALTIPLSGNHSYYYLRVTQPDGDIAVTAPVWIEDYADVGIRSFTSEGSASPGQEISLDVTLYNQEPNAYLVESITLYQGDTQLDQIENPGTVSRGGTLRQSFSYTCGDAGTVALRAVVTGSIAGNTRSDEKTMLLRCTPDLPDTLMPLSDIRQGRIGQTYRAKGFVTAGTSNPSNSFPNTIYLQDDTGGIAVTEFSVSGVQVGCPLEITGVLRNSSGNLILEMLEFTVPQEDYYRFVPRTLSCETALNYAVHGGELLQVQGKVISRILTDDGKGVSQFVIEDIVGGRATILIEPYIRSGSTGKNTLASQVQVGRTVRAMGLGHLDESGQSVLRVRNCEEVVYVPPLPDRTNPKTGDILQWLGMVCPPAAFFY